MIETIQETDLVTAIFDPTPDILEYHEFAQWIHQFGKAYKAACGFVEANKITDSEIREEIKYRNLPRLSFDVIDYIREKLRVEASNHLEKTGVGFTYEVTADRLYSMVTPIASSDLKITRLTYASPLIAEFAGWIPVIVIALALSGGEISYSRENGFKAKLPALGDGIRKLREAFQPIPPKKKMPPRKGYKSKRRRE